ncbi:ribosome maturation factor RimM [Tersicoccus phoenicis]|uniref:Ribosome maturation factor RimM n=1 Tax=Tersicoccus phoenicis TaxID=554083 RepID=A0A1R1LL93_9MICC|nr:ribosome maturation factor RimM [Tersicoccus phoenicis]OMH28321.1 ribosome maturation factor RimM [Tersicoccus phoenicis]
MQVRIARLGRPHGIRGEVTAEVLTDAPADRFVPGAVVDVEAAGPEGAGGSLTIRSARWNKGILLLGFDEVSDRNHAERLRGARLLLDLEGQEPDDDAWYEHELVDLDVVLGEPTGERIGRVTALQTMPAQDLLVIELTDGREVLVPFVEQIVPTVDLDARRVVLTPPPGLLDLTTDDAEDGPGAGAGDGPADGADDGSTAGTGRDGSA